MTDRTSSLDGGKNRRGPSSTQWAIIGLGLLSIVGFFLLDMRIDAVEASRDATAGRSQVLALQVGQECAKGGAAAEALGTTCKQASAIATRPVVGGTAQPAQKVLIPGDTITARATVRVTPKPVTSTATVTATTTATAPGSTATETRVATVTASESPTTTTASGSPNGTATETQTRTETRTETRTATRTETRTATATETVTATESCHHHHPLGLFGCH